MVDTNLYVGSLCITAERQTSASSRPLVCWASHHPPQTPMAQAPSDLWFRSFTLGLVNLWQFHILWMARRDTREWCGVSKMYGWKKQWVWLRYVHYADLGILHGVALRPYSPIRLHNAFKTPPQQCCASELRLTYPGFALSDKVLRRALWSSDWSKWMHNLYVIIHSRRHNHKVGMQRLTPFPHTLYRRVDPKWRWLVPSL